MTQETTRKERDNYRAQCERLTTLTLYYTYLSDKKEGRDIFASIARQELTKRNWPFEKGE